MGIGREVAISYTISKDVARGHRLAAKVVYEACGGPAEARTVTPIAMT